MTDEWVLREIEFLMEAGVIKKSIINGEVCYSRIRMLEMSEEARDTARRIEASARFFQQIEGTIQ